MASAKELGRPELADKLKLTPEQRQRIGEILEQHEELQRTADPRLPPGERPRRFLMLKGLEVLTSEQKQRLRELLGKPFGVGARVEQALAEHTGEQAGTKSDK